MGFCNSKQSGQLDHDPAAARRYRNVRVMSIPAVPGSYTRRNTDLSLASTVASTRGATEYQPLTAATSTSSIIDHSNVQFRDGYQQHIDEDQLEEEEERNRFSSERMQRLLAHRRFSESRVLEQQFKSAQNKDSGMLRHVDSKAEFAHRSSSFILETQDFDYLNKYIPSLLHRKWKLLYSSQLDGYSFATMLAKCENRGPLVFILQQESASSSKKNIFGFYVSPYLKRWDEFTGDDSCFMFRIVKKVSKKQQQQNNSRISTLHECSHDEFETTHDDNDDDDNGDYADEGTSPLRRNIYHATHNNSNYLYCNDKKKRHKDFYIGLALGGTAIREDSFQLVLSPDLNTGYCSTGIDEAETKATCTFRAPLLVTRPKQARSSDDNKNMVPFNLEKFEVYGFEYGSAAQIASSSSSTQLLMNSPAMDEMVSSTNNNAGKKTTPGSNTANAIIGDESPSIIEATGSHDEIKDPPRRRMSIADASSGAFVYKMFHNE